MGYVDPAIAIGLGAFILGLLLVVWGFFLRWAGKLRNLQGAAVLVGAAIALGLAVMSVGALFVFKALSG